MKPSNAIEAHFILIVAIICAGLWLRWSLFDTYGWIVIVPVAAAWLIYRAKRSWRK